MECLPCTTPYQYAYNSPLTYRDPSGLAPEKEKEREELLDLNPEDPFNEAYTIAMRIEVDGLLSSSFYDPDKQAEAGFDPINLFIISSGRTAGGSSAENGQGGKKSKKNSDKNENDATDMYQDDPRESTVLQDITEESRKQSWNQTQKGQSTNYDSEAGGTIRTNDKGDQIVVEAEVGPKRKGYVNPFKICPRYKIPENFYLFEDNIFATYH